MKHQMGRGTQEVTMKKVSKLNILRSCAKVIKMFRNATMYIFCESIKLVLYLLGFHPISPDSWSSSKKNGRKDFKNS